MVTSDRLAVLRWRSPARRRARWRGDTKTVSPTFSRSSAYRSQLTSTVSTTPNVLRVHAHLHHRARRVHVRRPRASSAGRPFLSRRISSSCGRTNAVAARGLVVRVVRVVHLEAAELARARPHAAVEDVDVAEEVHDERRWPGARRPPAACPPARSGRWFMTTTRSATSNASSWSCVTKTLVTWISSCSRRSHCRSSWRTLASSAPNGSSSSSTFGCGRQRAGQGDALPLPAGELRRAASAPGLPAGPAAAARARARRPRRFGRLPHAQAEGDVLEDGHVPEQRVVLEDEADVALADGGVGDVLVAGRARVPASADLQAGDDAQQRRLARARRAEQGEQRAGAAPRG